MFTPAMMPVTAGKKMAKKVTRLTESETGPQLVRRFSQENSPRGPVRKKITDSASTPMMKYCALIAQSAPFQTSSIRRTPSTVLTRGNQGRSSGRRR